MRHCPAKKKVFLFFIIKHLFVIRILRSLNYCLNMRTFSMLSCKQFSKTILKMK